jgi:DNA-binding transcriptional LysR family regulator
LQHLRIMAALAELGLVSKVADALYVTQSAISKQIAEIENALNAPVIYRERNRLFLTDVGRRLAVHAQAVIQQLSRAELELEAIRLGIRGHIRVGTVTSLAPTLLPEVIWTFRQAASKVSISVTEGHFVALRPLLERGEIDVLLARVWQQQELPGIRQIRLSSEPIVVVSGRNHPLVKRRGLTWRDALRWPWILPDAHSVAHRAIEAFFAQSGHGLPSDVIESQSLMLNLALMQRMPCLGIFPEALAFAHAARGDLAVLGLRMDHVLSEAWCFWREEQTGTNAALRPFLDCIQSVSRRS